MLVVLGILDIALTMLQANLLRVLRLLRVQRALRLLRAVRLAQVATFAVVSVDVLQHTSSSHHSQDQARHRVQRRNPWKMFLC